MLDPRPVALADEASAAPARIGRTGRDDTDPRSRLSELAERVSLLERANVELARSNSELAEFASVASHELRSPLQTIQGFAEILVSHAAGDIDPEMAECITEIERGTSQLNALIEALLTYARVGTGVRRREDVDCAELVRDCCHSLDSQIRDTRSQVSIGRLPTVVADPVEIAVVFRNLISNSIKYRRPHVPALVGIGARQVELDWQFDVVDNGIGIDPRFHERIFRVFQRLPGSGPSTGSGIGLAVCRRIIEGHGGRIWLDEEFSGGTRVSFTIPAPVCWSPFG